MLNKLEGFLKQYEMVSPGDTVICAVSGGADSVAMLFGLYLLSNKLQITLQAVHFNHHLRGAESQRDEDFVKALCQRYNIHLHIGHGKISHGKKGLEAAARDARYSYFASLSGKIATAHTADDNAETMLMHLIRGTGLKGLGGIAPVNGRYIRPMLSVTRQEVISFLNEYHLDFMTDSTNETDTFLRNRIRHHIMPLLKKENPRIAENMSSTAMRLREDESFLSDHCQVQKLPDVSVLRECQAPIRRRMLGSFLESCGVPEPESDHIALLEALVFSHKPSARADFPGNIVIVRNYECLELGGQVKAIDTVTLPCPGCVDLPDAGVRVICQEARDFCDTAEKFTVFPQGEIVVRCRKEGDKFRTSGGTKSLKKLFIDKKIPAPKRPIIPVVADDGGILGVYGFGADKDRLSSNLPAVCISFQKI